MHKMILLAIVVVLLFGCTLPEIEITPTREINYPTDVPIATEVPHVWLPGVNCNELANALAIKSGEGFTLLNGNPCIQRMSITDVNGINQAVPFGYEIVSEPGLESFSGHALIHFDPDQKAMVVELTQGGQGGNRVNGLWGWKLRGQHIPANTCALIKITGQTFLNRFTPTRSPQDQQIQITIDNGIEKQVRTVMLQEDPPAWEQVWPIYTSNPTNVFDVTFQVGQIWATAGGYIEVWSLQILTAPGHCNDWYIGF